MKSLISQTIAGMLLISLLLAGSCEEQKRDGVKTVHFPGTNIVQQSIGYKNGKKNGSFKEFFRNGNLKAHQHYRNDSLTDTSFFYHENGKLSAFQIIEKDKKQGCWRKFNKDGKMYWEVCFKDNVLDGVSTEYTYKSLRLIKRLNFKEGRKHGRQEHFYQNGRPMSVSYYDEGRPCVGTEEWRESGVKINNGFRIHVAEKNELLLKNKLTYLVTLKDQRPDDELFEIVLPDSGRIVKWIVPIRKNGNHFELEYVLGKTGYVMKTVWIAAFRKTRMGNTYIQKSSFIASANNF